VENMKIPYGISNFKVLREEKYLYIDKTKYIETIENLNSKYVFFIRPRTIIQNAEEIKKRIESIHIQPTYNIRLF